MSLAPLRELAEARDAARAALDSRIAGIKDLASPGTLAKRAQAEVTTRAHDFTTQAIEIASDNRGVVAATAAVLAGWLLRRPLLARASRWIARGKAAPPPPEGETP